MLSVFERLGAAGPAGKGPMGERRQVAVVAYNGIDGAAAARFTRQLGELLENPLLIALHA